MEGEKERMKEQEREIEKERDREGCTKLKRLIKNLSYLPFDTE